MNLTRKQIKSAFFCHKMKKKKTAEKKQKLWLGKSWKNIKKIWRKVHMFSTIIKKYIKLSSSTKFNQKIQRLWRGLGWLWQIRKDSGSHQAVVFWIFQSACLPLCYFEFLCWHVYLFKVIQSSPTWNTLTYAVQAWSANPTGKRAHAQFIRERSSTISSLSHCGLIFGTKVDLVGTSWSPLKTNIPKKALSGNDSSNILT